MGDKALKQRADPHPLLSSPGQHRSTYRLYPWLSAMGWGLRVPQTMCYENEELGFMGGWNL